jgi:hypothetical protein
MPDESDKSRYTGPRKPGGSSKPVWPPGEVSPWIAGSMDSDRIERESKKLYTPDLHRRQSAKSDDSTASPWGKILLWVAVLIGGWLLVRMIFA